MIPELSRYERVRRIIAWTYRMSVRHGAEVYGYGRRWDWGQALCVEQYGADPKAWPDEPSEEDCIRATTWEAGEWPDWAERKPPRAEDPSPRMKEGRRRGLFMWTRGQLGEWYWGKVRPR